MHIRREDARHPLRPFVKRSRGENFPRQDLVVLGRIHDAASGSSSGDVHEMQAVERSSRTFVTADRAAWRSAARAQGKIGTASTRATDCAAPVRPEGLRVRVDDEDVANLADHRGRADAVPSSSTRPISLKPFSNGLRRTYAPRRPRSNGTTDSGNGGRSAAYKLPSCPAAAGSLAARRELLVGLGGRRGRKI